MFLFQMKEISVYCMSKAAMDMFTQCMALGNVLKQIVRLPPYNIYIWNPNPYLTFIRILNCPYKFV